MCIEEVHDDATNETYVKFRPHEYGSDTVAQIRARLVAEDVVLHGMKEWLRRTGFGSFNKVRVRGEGETPVVSSIAWDLSDKAGSLSIPAQANGPTGFGASHHLM